MKILYFAPIAYKDLKQRPQHIAELLSKKHEIYYIEPTTSIVKYLIKGGPHYRKENYKKNGVHIIKLDGRFSCHRSIEALTIGKMNCWWEVFQLRKLALECDVFWVGYSGWYQIVKKLLKDQKLIFDKMDDEAELTKNSLLQSHIKKGESYLLHKADLIFVTAQVFFEKLGKVRAGVHLIPNGMDSDIFLREVNIAEPKICYKYLYIGHVGHWFDWEAIKIILQADEKNTVTIVGTISTEKFVHDRVTNIGYVDKGELPIYLNEADACLYPFKFSGWIDTINPVKIYEYLCFNKPVIAVESKELDQFGSYIYRYNSLEQLGNLVKTVLHVPFLEEEMRIQFYNQNNWETRIEKIETIIRNVVFEEKVI